MSMSVDAATARLSREMPHTEAAIEEALVASASLLLTAATARRDTGVRAVSAHSAMLRLAKLNQTLIEASGEASRVHHEMRKLSQDIHDLMEEDDNCKPSGSLAAQTAAA